MKEVVLGAESGFAKFPAEIEIDRHSYYLIKSEEGGYQLFSRTCPHAGYRVEAEGDGFYCDAHGWEFDGKGKCKNVTWGKLKTREVSVRDGELVAVVPE
jgi:nitrite reductase/ring-hydroxylating ferredoxin subunit